MMNCPKCKTECEGEDIDEAYLVYECGKCGHSFDSSEELWEKADMMRKAQKEGR